MLKPLTLINAGGGGQSSSSIGETRFLCNTTLNEFEFYLCGPVEKKEHSICLGLVVATRQSRVGSKFPNLKILNFLLLPQNFTTNQGLHSKFPHPTPRTAYQCPYAKEMRWIGPKMTELEPFSWTMSKFSIFDEVKIRDFSSTGPILGELTPFFSAAL